MIRTGFEPTFTGPGGVQRYFGKYRGTVVNNIDETFCGRIQVTVSGVSGFMPTTWATPCVPLTGRQMGTFFVPTVGSGVWVEFEQGDPDYPIYTGGFWGNSSELPTAANTGNPISPNIVIQTQQQHAVILSDLPGPAGGILLMSRSGAKISVSDTGIIIDNGQGATITLTGTSVAVNGDGLVVLR